MDREADDWRQMEDNIVTDKRRDAVHRQAFNALTDAGICEESAWRMIALIATKQVPNVIVSY